MKGIEKMEDKYSLIRKHSGIWRTLRDGDFEEEEIWDVMKEKPNYIAEIQKSKEKEQSSLPRMIPKTNSGTSSHETNFFQQSAPVNIPNWSKIYKINEVNKNVNNVSRYNNDYDYYNDEGDDDKILNHDDDEDEEDDEYNTRLPPHEIIARRFARSQISSFSVFEGVGRTLKGRDLSKLRNSVLVKTGFLESL